MRKLFYPFTPLQNTQCEARAMLMIGLEKNHPILLYQSFKYNLVEPAMVLFPTYQIGIKLLCLGAKHKIWNGKSTRFWLDWWQGSRPLGDRLLALYAITLDPVVSVAQAHQGEDEWAIPFRPELGQIERVEWQNLLREISNTQIL